MSFDAAIARIFRRLGSLATFTPVTGPAVADIYVHYEQESQIQGGLDGGVVRISPTVEYLLSDLGVTARNGDKFTIGSTVYAVGEQVSNDGFTAMVTVK